MESQEIMMRILEHILLGFTFAIMIALPIFIIGALFAEL
jgi:hypothetical protein